MFPIKNSQDKSNGTMKGIPLTFGVLAAAILLAGPAGAETLFEDNFDNGIVADSDEKPFYWVGQGNRGSILEKNGKVAITTRTGNADQAWWKEIASAGVDPTLDFSSRPVTFSGTVERISGTTHDPAKQGFRFSVGSEPGPSWEAGSLFRFEILRGQRIWFTEKVDGTATVLAGEKYPREVADFALALDADSYRLVVTDREGHETTFKGTHSLGSGTWKGNGACMALTAYKNKDGDSDGAVTIEIGHLKVVAEPAGASGSAD
jgi:hypothetical protein